MPSNLRITVASRRALVIQPFVVLFAVLLIGMLAWRVLSIESYARSIGAKVNWDKAIWTHVAIGAAILAIAGGIGALAYFTTKKNERAAAMAMAVVIGAGAAWFGYLNIWGVFKTNNQALGPRPATSPSPSPGSAPFSSPGPRATPPPRPTPSNPPPSLTPSPVTPATPVSPQGRPPVSPPSTGPSIPTPTLPPAPPPPSHITNPAIAPTVKAFSDELDAAAEGIAARFDALVTKLRNTPERSRSAQDSIVKEIDSLTNDGRTLSAKLESARADLEARLKSAGVPSADAGFAASRWHGEFRVASRQMAIDGMGRLFEPAREAAVLLRDTIGKWTIKGGEPDYGKDRDTQRKADWARQRLSGQLNHADSTSKQIRGR